MNQLVNALKAPFVDLSTIPKADQPTDRQVAAVWLIVGVLLARAL